MDLVRQGVLAEVSAETLLAGPGRSDTHRLERHVFAEGLARARASHGHRAKSWRPITSLSDAFRAVVTLDGPDRTRWLTHIAAAAIISGAEPPEGPAVRAGRRRLKLLRQR